MRAEGMVSEGGDGRGRCCGELGGLVGPAGRSVRMRGNGRVCVGQGGRGGERQIAHSKCELARGVVHWGL